MYCLGTMGHASLHDNNKWRIHLSMILLNVDTMLGTNSAKKMFFTRFPIIALKVESCVTRKKYIPTMQQPSLTAREKYALTSKTVLLGLALLLD